jgi:hypothetical protein
MSSHAKQCPNSQLALGGYNEVVPGWLLLGAQPVRPADIAFLAGAESVDAIVSVRVLAHKPARTHPASLKGQVKRLRPAARAHFDVA